MFLIQPKQDTFHHIFRILDAVVFSNKRVVHEFLSTIFTGNFAQRQKNRSNALHEVVKTSSSCSVLDEL